MHVTMRLAAPAAALLLSLSGVAFADAPKSGNAAFDRAVDLVEENFYLPSALPKFEAAVRQILTTLPATATDRDYDAAIGAALFALDASHTGHFGPDQLDYYELADIFRFNYRRDLERIFPPDGEITYPGIGIASAEIGGKRFITDIYDGGAAEKAGLHVGDEILSADGAPFREIDSFRGKVGKEVTLSVRRADGAAPENVAVAVADLEPTDTLVAAIRQSATVREVDGRRIGYLHIWTFAGGDVVGAIDEALAGPLAGADALVVDLRGRWGGAPPDAAEIFLGGTPPFRFIDRNGQGKVSNLRWHKPVVAIIDGGTRSGLEVFAYALKAKGVPLVGTRTAGNLLGGRGYMLPDNTLLEIAVAGVEVDGKVLEKNGVLPDVAVPFDIRYSGGKDPQVDTAFARARALLTDG